VAITFIEEPGRRIVKQELETGGHALPWIDKRAFIDRVISTALADREAARALPGWVFFDRGLIDAASALELLSGEPMLKQINSLHPYHQRVFLAPPWPEIFVRDPERRHSFQAGVAEYERLARELPRLGYEVLMLPRLSISERADFVLGALELRPYASPADRRAARADENRPQTRFKSDQNNQRNTGC
jgi:predicted ATPase